MDKSKYIPIDGCWIWTGSFRSGVPALDGKSVRRAQWHELNPGKTLANHMVVRTSCGNQKCVKPTHLKPFSRSDDKAVFMTERVKIREEYRKVRAIERKLEDDY